AAFDLVVPPEDPCLAGQTVRAAAVDYGFLPVAVLDAQGKPLPQPMNARLQAGCRLIAISMPSDLERLLRREPVPHEYAVEVTAFPLPARAWVASLLRLRKALGADEADRILDHPPISLGEGLSRGQAED